MLCKTISLAAAALSLATAVPAYSHDFSNTVRAQTTLDYSDLDIMQPSGASALLGRIESAAKGLCRPVLFESRREFRVCVRGAVDSTVASLNSPLVSALHRGDTAPISVAQRD